MPPTQPLYGCFVLVWMFCTRRKFWLRMAAKDSFEIIDGESPKEFTEGKNGWYPSFLLIFIKKLDFNWRNTWLFEFDSDLWAGGVRSTFWRSWWTGKLEFRVLKLAIDRIEMGCRSLIKLHGTILWDECPFRIASECLSSLIRRKLRRTFTVNLLLLGN